MPSNNSNNNETELATGTTLNLEPNRLRPKDLASYRTELQHVQHNTCGLCGLPFMNDGMQRPALDHCHTTGFIRGVLHMNCNIILGKIEWIMKMNKLNTQECKIILEQSIEYLNTKTTSILHPKHKTEEDKIIKDAKKKYKNQKARAIQRKIQWKFTFQTWWDWWQESNHWNERGVRKDQYCMCRKGDVGPYSIENVQCLTNSQNSKDLFLNGKNGTIKGIPKTEEHKKALSIPHPRQAGDKNRFARKNITPELQQQITNGRKKTKKWVRTPIGDFDCTTTAAQHYSVVKETIVYWIKVSKSNDFYFIPNPHKETQGSKT